MRTHWERWRRQITFLESIAVALSITAWDCGYQDSWLLAMTEDAAQITPEWSPDGSQIAFSYAWNLWLVDTKGARVKPLTGPKDRLDVDYSNINVSPDISPDGTQIAYTSHKRPTIDLSLSGSSSQFEIKTAKIDGSSKRKLDKNGAFDLNPAWSPDGTRLAFLSDRLGPGQYHLFTMSADGSDVRSIAPSVPEAAALFRPSSRSRHNGPWTGHVSPLWAWDTFLPAS